MRLTTKTLQAMLGVTKQKTHIAGAYKSNVKGWRNIGDKRYYFKSLWEINYAHYLEFDKNNGNILDWLYEPQLFRFPKEDYDAGPFLYKPDFKVITKDFKHTWHEVKGWMSPDSKKKTKRFRKHYPNETLKIIDKEWFSDASRKGFKNLVPGWEALSKGA